jgi:UDP-2,3-diacylglucosamine pyrophosphatase LpxH
MKICLIADTHWGIRGDVITFHDYFKKSVHEFLFPYLRENNIKHIIHLGDVVDRRRQINYMTAHRLRTDFLQPVNNEFQMDIIVGNHDTYFKNTNELNALHELIDGKYENIKIFTGPTTINDKDIPLLYVPWMCEDNIEQTISEIKSTNAQICLGHLDLAGFEMHKGSLSYHGFDHKIFDKFDLVCTGHFHHKSTIDNINYLGAFAEYYWSDAEDPRGFHVFDTETRQLEFVQNPFTMFQKLYYDDANNSMDNVLSIPDDLHERHLKIIVKNKTNPYWFDLYIDKIEEQSPSDIKVIEDSLSIDFGDDNGFIDEAQDTVTIFKSYIEQLNLNNSKRDKLQKTIIGLYQEAITIQ